MGVSEKDVRIVATVPVSITVERIYGCDRCGKTYTLDPARGGEITYSHDGQTTRSSWNRPTGWLEISGRGMGKRYNLCDVCGQTVLNFIEKRE